MGVKLNGIDGEDLPWPRRSAPGIKVYHNAPRFRCFEIKEMAIARPLTRECWIFTTRARQWRLQYQKPRSPFPLDSRRKDTTRSHKGATRDVGRLVFRMSESSWRRPEFGISEGEVSHVCQSHSSNSDHSLPHHTRQSPFSAQRHQLFLVYSMVLRTMASSSLRREVPTSPHTMRRRSERPAPLPYGGHVVRTAIVAATPTEPKAYH